MEVETTRFGTLSLGEEARVYFPEGLLGFSAYREYVMVPASASGGPLVWLQSCQAPELAFAVCRAEALVRGYQVQVQTQDLAVAELSAPEDAAVYLIVHRERGDVVANLRGPLVINEKRHLGKQVVINDESVPLRHCVRAAKRAREAASARATRRAV